jgi:CsoR family transcriptional regulator, copper-sensing transcriptional repressor
LGNDTAHRHATTVEREHRMAFLTGNKKQLIHRISGIEGHVGSLKRMFDEDRQCLEILMQISAIRSAIERLSHAIFEEFVEATLENIHTEEERSAAISEIRAAMETLK